MTAKFPASIATNADLGQPLGTDNLDAPDHAGIHRQITDEIIAMQTALGANLSGVAALVPPPSPSSLSALTDVDGTVSPSDDDALVWDATNGKWIAKQIVGVQNIDELNDVMIDPATLAADDALLWDDSALKWVAGPLPVIDTSKFLLTDDIDVADGVAGLDATGKIPVALLPPLVTGAMLYEGAKDVTTALGTYVPKQGSTIVPTVAGTVNASWTGAAGNVVTVSDVMVFDGTSWHIIAGAADLGTVVQKTSVLNDAGKRDVSVAIGAYSPKSNDVITIGKDTATPNASWVGLTGALTVGQQFMWNGSAWVAPDGSKLPSYGIEEKRYVSMLDLSASTLGDGTNPSIPKITIAGQEYRGDRINDAGSSDAGNIGIGLNALQYAHRPSGGASNVAVGENAGAALKAGSENILLGSWAGYKLVDGTANICIGTSAGDIPADPAASNNVAIGFRAHARTSGSLNVCIGNNAGREATRFDSVTIVGSNRSKANGDGTLHLAKTLQDSSAFGAGCNLGHNNSTVIGAGAASTKDNQVVLGGSATVEVKTAGTYEGVIGGIPQRMVGQLELGLILGAGNPSGVAEFDLGTARHFTHTLTENATLRVINLNPAGTGLVNEFDCLFFQDAVGGFTLTLPANFKAIGNSLKVMPATKNTYALFSAITYDFGVTWYYVMQECEA